MINNYIADFKSLNQNLNLKLLIEKDLDRKQDEIILDIKSDLKYKFFEINLIEKFFHNENICQWKEISITINKENIDYIQKMFLLKVLI